MIRITALLPLALLLVPVASHAQDSQPDCATVGQPWAGAISLAAARNIRELTAAPVTLAVPTILRLHPDGEVAYRSLPQGEGEASSYGGMALLTVTQPGIYRVAVNRSAWIDVVGPQGPAQAITFGRGAACSGVQKAVTFHLSAGEYALELSGSLEPQLGVLVELLLAD